MMMPSPFPAPNPSMHASRLPHAAHLHAAQEQAGVDNPAAILYGANDLRYEHHHMPAAIPAGHVRVLMRAVGICGSDVHFYKQVSPLQASLAVFVCILCSIAAVSSTA